jgi:hypothetical protein
MYVNNNFVRNGRGCQWAGEAKRMGIWTYGAECFIRIYFHTEKTWLHLFVTEQRRVELYTHDLRLARLQQRGIFHLVFQVHSLIKIRPMSFF